MEDLREGLEVGPYTLVKNHSRQSDCEIWKAHHTDGRENIALKFRKQSLMYGELSVVLSLLSEDATVPNALRLSGRSDCANMCGFYKSLTWIAERFYPYNLRNAPQEVIEKHWKTILLDCLLDLQCMYHWMHCDIKSENIVVDEDGHAAVIDFELCRNIYDAVYGNKWYEFVEEHQKYYNCLGAVMNERMGPRLDLEGLGIALGLRMMGYNQTELLCHTDTSEVRDWENLQRYIHPRLHPYMEKLQELEWNTKIPYVFRSQLVSVVMSLDSPRSSPVRSATPVPTPA